MVTKYAYISCLLFPVKLKLKYFSVVKLLVRRKYVRMYWNRIIVSQKKITILMFNLKCLYTTKASLSYKSITSK